eukprot:TRINITY_DN5127_c0_g1_i1.p1 TRINITY_DN5127_c0_g1~~TRINITY_DN5127_c0_g1_i1.p1  ORF type:complete len:232 (+),score=82.82 TRINITY_DN5127_c0_g1_i1:585-1280(+)
MQRETKESQKQKALRKEKFKQYALKGNPKLPDSIMNELPKPVISFETKVNIMLHEEDIKSSEELRDAQKILEEKKRYVKKLERKKKDVIFKMEKGQAEKARRDKAEDEKNYRVYQQELKDKLRIFLADKIKADKDYRSKMLNEHLFYAKLNKIKALSDMKKQWLEEFEKTLELGESKKKLAEQKAAERQMMHKEFIEKVMKDKEYRRELFLANKLLEVINSDKENSKRRGL